MTTPNPAAVSPSTTNAGASGQAAPAASPPVPSAPGSNGQTGGQVQPASPSNGQAGNPVPLPQMAPGTDFKVPNGSFSQSQVQQLADWAVADGKMSSEDAAKMLTEHGIQPSVPMNPEQAAHDRDFPPARSHEFTPQPLAKENGQSPAEYTKADGDRRAAMAFLQMPRSPGTYVLDEMARTSERYARMDPIARKSFEATELALATRALGPNWSQRIGLGKALLFEVGQKFPDVVKNWEASGALHSSAVWVQIVLHSERRLERYNLARPPEQKLTAAGIVAEYERANSKGK